MDRTLLGGLPASSFLRRHWQKQPLLIRQAITGFEDTMSLQRLIALARNDACEARLVIFEKGRYAVYYGPFSRGIFRDLPEKNWTLLVQGVNHVCPSTRALLERFSFLPFARLDDVMVSYAAPGGGVGPHFDSYDVFLLQGKGQRMWEVGTQSDLELLTDSELRILRRFHPDGRCLVSQGDMLYLPPRFAHNGTALDNCITYSIGFRAPGYEELKTQFLAFLDDSLHLEGRYDDPELMPTAHPARLGNDMIDRIAARLSRISWNRAAIADFLGCYLSEPKPYIVINSPPALDYRKFCGRARARGIEVHPALPLLYSGNKAFINGEVTYMKPASRRLLRLLADRRRLTASQLKNSRGALQILHSWYGNGYLSIGEWDRK